MDLIAKPSFHARMKHMEIDYHFVHEKVAAKSLAIRYLPSETQIVDCSTKPLPAQHFPDFCSKLTVLTIYVSLRGMLSRVFNVYN